MPNGNLVRPTSSLYTDMHIYNTDIHIYNTYRVRQQINTSISNCQCQICQHINTCMSNSHSQIDVVNMSIQTLACLKCLPLYIKRRTLSIFQGPHIRNYRICFPTCVLGEAPT